MTERVTTGGCLCGDVRFEVSGPLRDIVVCHCSLCRRWGTTGAAYTWAERRALRLLGDEPAVYLDVNGRERSFCARCGSSLFWARPGDDSISIAAGALEGDAGLRVVDHIYVSSAAAWEEIPGGEGE